jgi:FKBP-type peptidyl-prolyl cis-trans isomerase
MIMQHNTRILNAFASLGFIVAIGPLGVMPAPAAAQGDAAANSAVSAAEAIKNDRDKLSYAIGASLGARLRRESVDVDVALVSRGIKDGLSSAGMLLSEQEIIVIVSALENEIQKKRMTAEAERIVAANALAEKNKKAGEAFLAENKKKEGVVTLDSGLQYRILKPGDSKKPSADDTVVCHYRAVLIDGTELDSSYKKNKPLDISLKGVIKGWSEAVQLMPVGSKWQLFIPASLAYGEAGAPRSRIGPNSTLIFDVELVSIKDKSAEKVQANSVPSATETAARK